MERLSHTPVILFKGELDEVEPTLLLRAFHERLRGAGALPELHLLPDVLHDSNSIEVKLFPLLLKHRNPRPSVVIAEVTAEARNRVHR